MRRAPILLAVALLCGCSDPPAPPPQMRYPLLPNADAESPVKIESVRKLCEKFDRGETQQVIAQAFRGQKLRWLGTVRLRDEQHLQVGVGSLVLDLHMQEWESVDYDVGAVVEVGGVIKYLDLGTRLITLSDPTAAAPLK